MTTTTFSRWIIPILVLGSVFVAAFTATAQNYYPADIGNKWVLENTRSEQQLTYTLETPKNADEQEYILLKIETVKQSIGEPDKVVDLDQYFLSDAPDAVKLHKTILQQDPYGIITANFPTPVTFFPKVLELGDKWQITADTKILTIPVKTISNLEVVAFEDVVTPAGTFQNCAKVELKLEIRGAISGNFDPTYQWLAPDVGPVKYKNTTGLVFRLVSSNLLTPGVALAGVGALAKQTTNASTGVNYTLRVTNTGSTNDTFRLSTSGDVSATLSRSTVSLAPKASIQVTARVDDPALAAPGSYAVKVTATSQKDTTQTADITTTTTILPVYAVTLAGVGELAKQTTDASTGVNYTLNITNTGNTQDTFRLSTSGDANATLSQYTVPLAPKASTQVTVKVAGAALSAAGSYAIKVTATSQNDSTQTADITTTTTVPPVYRVTLAGVGELTKQTTDASTGVNYTLNITNTGNTQDTFNLATSGDVTATLSQSTVSLSAGASAEVTVTIADPALANAGTYAVKVIATSQGNNTQTAEATTTTTILPIYGITLAGVGELTKQTTDASTGVNYTLNITNTGNTNDTFNLATSGDVTATLSQTAISLSRGASAEVTVTIADPALANAGTYAVKVIATSQENNTQTAEATTTTTILPIYGITLAGVGELTKQTTDASTGVNYTLNITNTGNTNDTFNLATSGDVTATLSQTAISLSRGASAEVTVTIADPALANAGTYAVKVIATSQGDNTQTAEATTTTTILPIYGITLAGVGELTKQTTDASTGVNYTLNITNTGNTNDTFNLATSGDVTATLSQTAISLSRGASAEVTVTIADPALANAGTYAIKVTATSQGDNTQTAEATTTTTILPIYGIALAGVGELTKQTTDASTGVNYTLNITNTGNTNDTFNLATSGDVTATLSQTAISLSRGASAEVTVTIADPALANAGTYAIKVTATSQGNNTQTAEATITTTILPVYAVTLAGVGELTKQIATAGEPVNYTLNITNTGNTADVIDITTTGDVAATLSQSTVSLSAGASAEVTMTVDTAALSTAGDYAVMVTATSQGDTTQTAEATTTTTLLPVTPAYGVKFEGDSERAGSTVDVLSGVSYTVTVTNTGNMDDTIVLSSSAEIGIEGSVRGTFTAAGSQGEPSGQLEVVLAPGTSAEVLFTAAGDAFTKPGEYTIEVTATSQNDRTKTAMLTITTTITPVPSDVNADGMVNILDLVKVANQFGEVGDSLVSDVTMDGVVNILDLVKVANQFGKTQVEIVTEN